MAVLGQWETKRVIFTGGEPAMQKLRPLSDELHSKGYNIAIETNGTIELEDGLVDWICVSPKDMLYPEFSIKQRKGHELKVVYTGQDLAMYDNLKKGFENLHPKKPLMFIAFKCKSTHSSILFSTLLFK